MGHWLVKSEPSTYAWADLVRDRHTRWDGVRNHQARNNLAAMRNGDPVLFYHSVGDREVVGIARVIREAYPDPTADDARWLAVDVEAVEPLRRPVGLDEIKAHPSLDRIALVRQGRLSVMPLAAGEFRALVALSKRDSPRTAAATGKSASGDRSPRKATPRNSAGKREPVRRRSR
jgi:predicted RNA-binding protein with PUA-like domain